MKCLVIHGSPRRGNTWSVLKLVEDEMKKHGEFEFEEIELIREKIPSCLGCFNCILKGENMCPHKDTIQKIVKKIEESDGIIITSPVYSLQLSGLLKNFIDHMSYNFHRPKFFNKKALIITTTAGAGHKKTAQYIEKVINYWGVNHVISIAIAYRGWDLSDKNKEIICKKAIEYSNDLNSGKVYKAKLKNVVMYNIWKCFGLNGDVECADYKYWNNSKLKDYVFCSTVPVSFINRVIGKIVWKVLKNKKIQ